MPENDPDETLKDRTVPLHELAQRKAPRIFGGYELRGELGRGGMGVVYRAHQMTLKRMVALKMLTGDYVADDVLRFRAEAEMAAGLQHPNIVHIHEVGEEDGVPFFSMEFVEGGTLGDLLLRGLPAPKQAAEMMMTLARAMHYAHRQGVVHRDMKPGNVLIGSQGEIKIADFGIAKRIDGEGSMTLSGAVMGTPVYMAPEQARGHSRKVGPAADVYALGALFYHLLSGRPPFLPDESDTALTLRVLQEDPVSPAWHRPEVPRDLETICLKALQKEPADRYSSADAMAEDLRRYLGDEPILAHPPTKIVRTVKWVKRHPLRLTLLLLLAGLLGAGGQRWWQWECPLLVRPATRLPAIPPRRRPVDRSPAPGKPHRQRPAPRTHAAQGRTHARTPRHGLRRSHRQRFAHLPLQPLRPLQSVSRRGAGRETHQFLLARLASPGGLLERSVS